MRRFVATESLAAVEFRPSTALCPECGRAMQTVRIQFHPLLPDCFDSFVGCSECGNGNADADTNDSSVATGLS